MIRDCEKKDIPALVAMSKTFWQYTLYKDEEFQEDAVEGMILASIKDNLCIVYDVEGKVQGFVCGIKGYLMANFDVSVGTELAWWVNEDFRNTSAGLKLLKAIERRAKSLQIKYWNMAYMNSSMPESIKKIYESMGYKENECLYTKVL
jgi:N-acetylglutamate synthase-like GNAT family acetyltransferase